MSFDIASLRTILIPAVIAVAMGSARVAAADTYTVVGAPGVDRARVSRVADALEATGRTVVVVDTYGGPAADTVTDASAAAAATTEAIKGVAVSFAELDYARVIAQLESAETTYLASLLGSPEGIAALVELNVWLGASLIGAGRNDQAAERYAQVLAIDSRYEMDPDYWAEEYTAAFGAARERSSPATGSLTIETNPDGATIAIDGSVRDDTSPATIEAAAGWHYIYLRRPGHRPWAQRLNVAAGEVKRIPVALSRDEALVSAALGAAIAGYETDPAGSVRAIVELTGRDDTIVVTADGLVLHDRTGGVRGRATGGDAHQQVDALFPGVTVPGGGAGKPWYKSTWFIASSAVAVVVAGSIGIWAVTRNDELRGVFVRP